MYSSYRAAVIKSKGLSLEARAEWIHCQERVQFVEQKRKEQEAI